MSNPGLYGFAGGVLPSQPLPFGPAAASLRRALRPEFSPPGVGTIDGIRAVFVGDSITAANSLGAGYNRDSYSTHLVRASAGKIQLAFNAGRGGKTSSQLSLYLETEVWALNPTVVFCMLGRNDPPDTAAADIMPLETFLLVDALRKGCATRGISLVIIGQPPQGIAAYGTPPAPTAVTYTTGGSLAAATYRYRVAWTNGLSGETIPSPAVEATTTGTTGSVRVDVPVFSASGTYKVYKETTPGSGTYALAVTLSGAAPVPPPTSWLDTGSVTPSGAPVSSDGTGNGGYIPLVQARLAGITLGMSNYARQYGCLFVDIGTILTDITTGMYAPGMSSDGTHPTPRGQRLIGERIWAQVGSYFRPAVVAHARANVDPANKMTNPLLLTTASGLPTGWSKTIDTGGGGIPATVGPVSGFSGNALTLGVTDGLTVQEYRSNYTTSATTLASEVLEWSCRVSVTGADTGGGYFYVYVFGSNNITYYATAYATDGSGILSGRFSGGGNVNYQFIVGVRSGPVVASIGELCVVNLTRSGNARAEGSPLTELYR